LTAEEVPRWFGLSIVLIYLVGLGSVAQFGIVQARREGASQFQRGSRYTVKVLGERLSALNGAGTADPAVAGAYQRALHEFAANVPVRWLRVVDDERRVLASTDPSQINTIVGDDIPRDSKQAIREVMSLPVPGQKAPDVLVRVRLTLEVPTPQESVDDQPPRGGAVLHLEARLPPEPFGVSGPADQARMLAIVLVVLGALFVVYRCLREQLRSMSRIADRLQSHRDRLQEDLGSLRIGDSLDGVTTAWNDLIDLTEGLSESVQHSEADEELSRVLQCSWGGALAEALSAVPDGLIYIADEIRFEYMNSAACRLFGWNVQDAKGMILPEARASGIGAKVLDVLRGALQTDGSFEVRTDVLEADDKTGCDHSTYRVRILPLQRDHHTGECVVVIRDVSQQVRAERSREEFITHVTHELRTPLTNIRAYAETLSSGMFEDPNVITECYNVITKETRRLSRLVEDVLSVSQLEVGTIDLQIADIDLKTLLSEGVRDVRGLADDKNIDVQLVLPSKVEPIAGDRDKLAVVINNLLGNAIKYTPPDGNVVVGCRFTGQDVAISIKDNGIGIDPADHGRVFEKFQRSSDPDVQNETGSGIGLYTAREIVRHHRGEIELISEKGQGSTFLVRLPRQETRAAALSTAKEA